MGLKIYKIAEKVFRHNDTVKGDFVLSKFYAKEEFDKFLVVEIYGSEHLKYAINEIEVYDIGGSVETFPNFVDLFTRLAELRYTAFYSDRESEVNWGFILGDISSQTDLITRLNAKLNTDISTYTDVSLPLVDNDEFLVNRSGVWHKVDKSEIGGGGGASAFISLTDAPSSYTGQANKVVSVKADESGLEFTTGGGGGSSVNIQTTITGIPTVGTTETISQSIFIPANTITLGLYDLLARSFKNNTLGNATNKLYINNSVTLVGALQLATGTTPDSGRRTNPIQRFLNVKVLDGTGRGTVVQNLSNTVNAYNYDSVSPSDLAIDWTSDQYIIHTIKNVNSTETSVSEYIKLRE